MTALTASASDSRDDQGRFRPGHSGNPGGRPASRSINAAIRERLEYVGDDGLSRAERIAALLVSMAEAGDLRAIREVLDRSEGKPTQAVHLNAHEEIVLNPITFDRCEIVARD